MLSVGMLPTNETILPTNNLIENMLTSHSPAYFLSKYVPY